jgi:Ser/Thr protein kinase RdoA (MazF antagonist)
MSDFYDLDPQGQEQRLRALAVKALESWNLQHQEITLIKYRENAVFQLLTNTGDQLGSIEDGLGSAPQQIHHTYLTIGQICGRLHNQASEWLPPADFERHHWDIEGLLGEQPLWGRFWELEALTDEQRELIDHARKEVRQGLLDYGQSTGTYSMIHADFAPENFLVNSDGVRLIDFDDAGFGWHLFDIATALYFIQDDPHYEVARSALIEGYREYRALSDQQLGNLPLFMAARSFTYLGWVHTRKGTQTAMEMTPVLVDMCCAAAKAFLQEY